MANATSKNRALHVQTLGTRLTWVALGVGASVVLVLARVLTPAHGGVGTHTQLGLPPCGFLWLTGLPCPGCGLTTSFAHLARWQWEAAVAASPLGVPLFLGALLAVPFCAVAAVRAWPITPTVERFHAEQALYVLATAAGLSWIARLSAIWMR